MNQSSQIKILILIASVAIVLTGLTLFPSILFSPRTPTTKLGISTPTLPKANQNPSSSPDQSKPSVEIVAQNLTVPWGLAFLPSGELLVTQRPGSLIKITPSRKDIATISGVEHIGESGLLGIAVHSQFNSNRFIYLYYTRKTDQGLFNQIDRFTLTDDQLKNQTTIMEQIPASRYHDGGRIAFGPDGYLYATVGDAGQPQLAQDIHFLHGKILRLTDTGSIPPDNPFGNFVYSYGHRNPQGLTWDNQGRLWSTEHGPSGATSGFDELNLIKPGKNYGWPLVQGDQTRPQLQSPVIQSGSQDTWAPADALFYQNSIFIPGLRGQSLYQAKLKDNRVSELTTHFYQDFGRLRSIILGPDGYFYLSTSNTDGRGQPKPGDDKIIRLNPKLFF